MPYLALARWSTNSFRNRAISARWRQSRLTRGSKARLSTTLSVPGPVRVTAAWSELSAWPSRHDTGGKGPRPWHV